MTADPWQQLERWAALRGPRRQRLLVPAIGSGFNAQAASTKAKGWSQLLDDIAKETNSGRVQAALASPDVSMTLLWEAILTELATQKKATTAAMERYLQKRVAKLLTEYYPCDGPTADFATRFVDLGFADILSFNFDDCLRIRPARITPAKSRSPQSNDPLRIAVTLACHTRIWYPHGHVSKPHSIRLGMRSYGTYIESLRRAFSAYKLAERKAGATTPAQRRAHAAKRRQHARVWLDVALHAPMLFLGLSMGRDEWPLWWFLNQRARNAARHGERHAAPIFIFGTENLRRNLEGNASLVGATFLTVPSDRRSEGWRRLFDVLGT